MGTTPNRPARPQRTETWPTWKRPSAPSTPATAATNRSPSRRLRSQSLLRSLPQGSSSRHHLPRPPVLRPRPSRPPSHLLLLDHHPHRLFLFLRSMLPKQLMSQHTSPFPSLVPTPTKSSRVRVLSRVELAKQVEDPSSANKASGPARRGKTGEGC